jgi:flagellar biosynthesis protein FlhA
MTNSSAANLRVFFNPTILLAIALMAVIVMMILPVPSWLLDLGLAASFALAVLIFTITLFVERPLDFSVFPTVLLASLVLRLSLNVSSTKLIIGQGHTGTNAAGDVIEGFASFIMGGSVLLGLVVFCVLLIVNFIVITKGAGRMAEVAARFALDGMPGRQLAIDSDMSAGAIDHAEAKARRERELAETNFFGSLDGASKFVKGDAVAGLLITLLNLVVGLVMGVFVHGMAVGHAFETYAILTMGDGLVNQIPAVIISIAAGLLLARGGATGSADIEILGQFSRHPGALATVGVLMAVFAVVPGLPFVPFMLGAAALGVLSYLSARRTFRKEDTPPAPSVPAEPRKSMGDILDLDEIHLEFAPDMVAMVLDPATGLEARITSIRSHVATQFGLILPEMRLTDEAALPKFTYRIKIQGVTLAQGTLVPDMVLVLAPEGSEAALPEGQDTVEPVYGAKARWVTRDRQEQAALAGLTVVTPTEVLATHLLELIKGNLPRLLTLRSLRKLLDEFAGVSDRTRAEANRKLLDELIPDRVTTSTLLAVLRLLLEERVSIRNLPLILEAIADARAGQSSPELICEHVRVQIGFQIVADLKRPDGTIPLFQLSPKWDEVFAQYQTPGDRGVQDIALPPEKFSRLARLIAERYGQFAKMGVAPALVCSTLRRRFLRTVAAAQGLDLVVLAYDEIDPSVKPALLGEVPA